MSKVEFMCMLLSKYKYSLTDMFWPRRLACAMRSLAIVITIVQPFSLSFSLRLLLLTHFGETLVCENLFPPIFWHN